MFVQVGKPMVRTVDCFTRPGSVQLVSELPGALEEDYAKIRDLEKTDCIFSLSH